MASSRSIIVNAFVMSLFGVLCVIGFDKQADSVQKRGGTVGVKDSVEDGIKGLRTEGQMKVRAIVEQGTSSVISFAFTKHATRRKDLNPMSVKA